MSKATKSQSMEEIYNEIDSLYKVVLNGYKYCKAA